MEDEWSVRNFLDDLTDYLRGGDPDHFFIDYTYESRNGKEESRPYIHYLYRTLLGEGRIEDIIKKYPRFRSQRSSRRVAWPIMEFLSRNCAVKQLFAYRSRFSGPLCEETANACEYLQASEFDDETMSWMSRRSSPRPGQKLNPFRLAQKIRNEHGIVRRNPPLNWSRSFEKIVELERKIEGGEFVDFMLSCAKPELIRRFHLYHMYESTPCISQLEAFHAAVIRRKVKSWPIQDLRTSYESRFKTLALQQGPLAWREVKKYRESAYDIYGGEDIFYGAEIQDEELDEAVNCFLNSLCASYESQYSVTQCDEARRFLKRLLDRGASLYFRDPDEGLTSFEALVEFSEEQRGRFPIWDFSDYICCPLMQDFHHRIRISSQRVARLSCLASSRIPQEFDRRKIPHNLRSFVEAHQALASTSRTWR